MFNEFQQMSIVAVAIVVVLLIFYFIFKRRSTPQTPIDKPEKHDIPQAAMQETVKAVPDIPLHEKEKDSIVITPVHKEESTGRRKSDQIIPKRVVPEHGKITKENFSEFSGERILVAEDNIINQKVLLNLLAGSGIDLVIANDGQEALDILENDTNFSIILMDAHMPRVDGFQATRTIRENPKYDHIVVVALSGDTASDDRQKMKDAGMSEQLEKPLRMESLYKIIYAYSGKEIQKAAIAETVISKQLNIEIGLQTCGGDESFYREILTEFMTDYGHSSDTLGEFLRSNSIQAADAYLLDIIGVAENIGGHQLAKTASNLKLALRDRQEQSYFSLFDQYRVHYDTLMQEIKAYL